MGRVYAVSAPPRSAEPSYTDGLCAAVDAAIDYAIDVVELGAGQSLPIPPVLLAQARLAVRNGVRLETVLRRYVAGYTLLADFVRIEIDQGPATNDASFRDVMPDLGAVLDRLLAVVSGEYEREVQRRLNSAHNDNGQRMKDLLAARPFEPTDEALAASVMKDKRLATSLFERYLSPLDNTTIGGRTARKALRALFAAEHNVSSAAHVLNVHRSSVHRWRNEIESQLGCRLCEHQADIEIALRIEELRNQIYPGGEH